MHILALGSFDDLRDACKPGVGHQRTETLLADEPLTDMIVPVDPGAKFFLRIIDVHGKNAVKADNGVEFLHRLFPSFFGMNSVTGRKQMARIKAYRHAFVLRHQVHNAPEVLKPVADCAPLAGGRFKSGQGAELSCQSMSGVDRFRDPLDPFVLTCSDMGSRMEDETSYAERLASLKLVGQSDA